MNVANVGTVMSDADLANRLGEKGIHSREELVERVKNTFTPGEIPLKN